MDPFVFTLVLTAAVLHASWNALIKSGGDPWVRLALTNFLGTVLGLALLPFITPPNAEAWPYILASVATHQIYFVTVCLQYRYGDLSHVYPISRGSAPLMVAFGAYLFVGETLSPQGIAAVALISAAIFSLTFSTTWKPGEGKGVFFALCTGLMIALYSVLDGIGGRTADDVISYIAYLFLIDGVPFGLVVLYLRRHVLVPVLRDNWKTGLTSGLLSYPAYALVIWAMTLSPLTYVSALRETSVILAVLIGTRMLGEPFGTRRLIAAALVAAGVAGLQFS
ncbi:MAG: EamA family transporter [Alphaproteobacteria bacterium]|jgi:drug/metabolite transporter (DMT)-like permease|nr:EamA family transporter [Alphaproteobacteria bacterium]